MMISREKVTVDLCDFPMEKIVACCKMWKTAVNQSAVIHAAGVLDAKSHSKEECHSF